MKKLASQGINVVIVALADKLLETSLQECQAEFPTIKFRSVGVNLGASDPISYMDPLIAATKDIDVALVFNNAGIWAYLSLLTINNRLHPCECFP